MNDDVRQQPPPPATPDRLLDHQYDGIQEYDNPMPKWWVWIFWVTIAWSVLYVLNVPGIGTGRGRIANYERDMAAAAKKYGGGAGTAPAMTEDSLVAITHDPARLKAGEDRFKSTCSPCHQADGGGLIGPNLTDAYWIHGGTPLEIFHTVTSGVLAKGMPAWGQTMNPREVAEVTAYVMTLRGTHPASPKEPQGLDADSLAQLARAKPATATNGAR